MCGRYAASRDPDDLVEEFEVVHVEVREPIAPSWNVAPTDAVHAVLTRRSRDAPEGEPPVRQLRGLRWGLVPSWSRDASGAARMINARVETVAEKPAFRSAFAKRRCLLPADGYYEWYTAGEDERTVRAGDAPRPRKQPFFIHPADGGVLAMAGLYEFWRDPAADPDVPGSWLWTCTILTTTAEDSLGRIHDRMPMAVERERWEGWLDPSLTDPDELRGLLVPAGPGRLEAYAVAPLVNSVRNNGPELVQPLAAEGEPAGGTLF